MKVLLNLISCDAGIDKSSVTDWVFRFFEKYKSGTCTVITEQSLPTDIPNLQQIVLSPPHNKTTFSAWKRIKLIPLLRKQNSDVLITWDAIKADVSKKQVLVLSPVTASYIDQGKKDKFRIKALERMAGADLQIVVFSEKEMNWIVGIYPSHEKNIKVIYRIQQPGNTSIAWQEKETIQSRWSAGNEFFMTAPPISMSQLKMLLKSYSGFKKWQKSNMELLVGYTCEKEAMEVNKVLKNYRFRDSVKLISSEDDEFSKVLSAAYAVILPEKYDSNFDFLFTCVKACTPVLMPGGSIYLEIMGEAGLQFGFNDQESLTKILLQVFKDEALRSQVILMQREVLKRFESYDPSEKFFDILRG